jgi:hypothetical protein
MEATSDLGNDEEDTEDDSREIFHRTNSSSRTVVGICKMSENRY